MLDRTPLPNAVALAVDFDDDVGVHGGSVVGRMVPAPDPLREVLRHGLQRQIKAAAMIHGALIMVVARISVGPQHLTIGGDFADLTAFEGRPYLEQIAGLVLHLRPHIEVPARIEGAIEADVFPVLPAVHNLPRHIDDQGLVEVIHG